MIKGEAQLLVSPETMIAVVQKWVDDNISGYRNPAPQVVMVHPITEDGKFVESFKISLREREPSPPK